MTTPHAAPARPSRRSAPTRTAPSPPAGTRADAMTMALGTWLLIGLFVDGWAHNTRDELETFFTPWHGLFYSGFAATAAWIGWVLVRRQEAGLRGRRAIPPGYGLAVAGVAVFAAGGAGDLAWHAAVGIEQGFEALFSPTHLLLFAGILLILSTPLRAAWPRPGDRLPAGAAGASVVASATLSTAATGFMLMFLSPYLVDVAFAGLAVPAGGQADPLVVITTAAIAITTSLLLVLPTVVLARRWVLPTGAVASLWGTTAALGGALDGWSQWGSVLAVVVAGAVVDIAVRRLQAGRTLTAVATWAVGAGTPALLWGLVFALHAAGDGIGLPLEIWTGTILWAGVVGGLVALCAAPPACRLPSGA